MEAMERRPRIDGGAALIEVRQETADDFDAVRRVHTEAFARHGHAGNRPPEVALADELRGLTGVLAPALPGGRQRSARGGSRHGHQGDRRS